MHCDRARHVIVAASILGALSLTSHPAHATTLYIGRTTGGSSAFTSDSSPPSWRAVPSADLPNVNDFDAPALGDLDRDGDLDVLVGQERGEILAFRNDGSDAAPQWVRQTAWEVGRTGITRSAPALGDLDGDGDLDLLVGSGGGNVDPYENTGSRSAPRWTARAGWSLGDLGNDSRPALADLNGDGHLDAMIGLRSSSALGFTGTGDASAPLARDATLDAPPLSGDRFTPALGDLDGDGRPDLLIADGQARFSAFQNAAGSWVSRPAWAPADPGFGPVGVALAGSTLGGTVPPPPPPPDGTPTARLTATPRTGSAPLTVTFDASTSTDPQSDPLTHAWDFGDGTTQTPADPDAILAGMSARYDAAKTLRDDDRFDEAIDAYLECVADLLPLTSITRTGPTKVQGTNRVDRVARWYLQKIAHDLGAIYLFNSLGLAVCPRYETALQFTRESVTQALAGGFPQLPDLNGTTANLTTVTSRLGENGCTIPAPVPMFVPEPVAAGPIVEHRYTSDGTYTARVEVSDGTHTASAQVTITVGDTTPPPPPPPPPPGDDEPLEGFGATTPGGANGRIVRVTTATPDALKAAIDDVNRTGHAQLVFETTGPIAVHSRPPAITGSFITIEGNGVTLDGSGLGGSMPLLEVNGHDVIVRNVRLRNGGDNLRIANKGAWNVVVSHVSSTGARDDGISIGYGAHDVTVQYSFLAGNTRSIFMKYSTTTNVSLHHDWIQKYWIRGPIVAQSIYADVRNLLIEDWTLWGARFESAATGNFVGCVFRLSAAGKKAGGKVSSTLNLKTRMPVYTADVRYEGLAQPGETGNAGAPLPAPAVTTHAAADVVGVMQARAGCLPRDAADQRYIDAPSGWDVSGSKPLRLYP